MNKNTLFLFVMILLSILFAQTSLYSIVLAFILNLLFLYGAKHIHTPIDLIVFVIIIMIFETIAYIPAGSFAVIFLIIYFVNHYFLNSLIKISGFVNTLLVININLIIFITLLYLLQLFITIHFVSLTYIFFASNIIYMLVELTIFLFNFILNNRYEK